MGNAPNGFLSRNAPDGFASYRHRRALPPSRSGKERASPLAKEQFSYFHILTEQDHPTREIFPARHQTLLRFRPPRGSAKRFLFPLSSNDASCPQPINKLPTRPPGAWIFRVRRRSDLLRRRELTALFQSQN